MYIYSDQCHPGAECDGCSKPKAELGALCQGATGRVCEVLWMCRECAGQGPFPDAEYARNRITSIFNHYATADF